MNLTLGTLLRLFGPSVNFSPAFCRQVSTTVLIVNREKNFLGTRLGSLCYKNTIRHYNTSTNHYTKELEENKQVIGNVQALNSTVNKDNLEEKNELKTLVEVVKDVPDIRHEEGDWTDVMQWVKSQESPSVLEQPKDVSDIDVLAPTMRPSFNLAAYVNKSETLQELLKLGVDLSIWDGLKDVNEFILPLDFERDIKQYIVFLYDKGVPADRLGWWLTRNPFIFKEDLENLQTRINYLEYMKFTNDEIVQVLSKNPKWLLYNTLEMDRRLGFFQKSFQLRNHQVRYLAVKGPRLITSKLENVKRTSFSVLEEMGFEMKEMKSLILQKPKIWMAHRESLLRRFDFAHNHMGLTHQQILQFPHVLLTRDFKLKQRHGFLKLLQRDQYDPTKPNYVSPKALAIGTDADFCLDVAKSSLKNFNDFLKTM